MLKNLLKKLKNLPLGVRAGIWFVILQYIQQAIIIIATPVFTRLLPTEDYGLVNVYNTWQSILNIVLTLKLSASIYQLQMVEYKEDRDNLTSSLVAISSFILLGASVIILLFNEIISSALRIPASMLYVMMADIWAQMILSFWLTRNKFEYNYKSCLFVVLINCFFRTFLSIALVYFAKKDLGYYKVLGNLIPELIIAICIVFRIYRKGKKWLNKTYWLEAIKFNIVIVPSYLSEILLSSSDRLMIDHYCQRSDVAMYSLAYSCAHLAQLFFAAINWVFTPFAYNCLNQSKFSELRKIANLLTLLMASLTSIVIILAPEAIEIFAPTAYSEAVRVIPPAACGIFMTFIYGFFINTEYYYKKNVYITVATIIGALVNIGLNIVFIPIYGYIAAAYTTVLGYIIMTLVHYFFYRRTIKNSIYDIKTLSMITVILYAFSGVCLVLYDYKVIRYIILILIFVSIIVKRKTLFKIFADMRKKDESND